MEVREGSNHATSDVNEKEIRYSHGKMTAFLTLQSTEEVHHLLQRSGVARCSSFFLEQNYLHDIALLVTATYEAISTRNVYHQSN